MEITTVEEAHVVGLFPTAAAAANAADEVRALLPEIDDDYTRFFGEQFLMSARGIVRGAETRALALATPLRLDEAVALIKRYGGLAVAAHIDRPTFGVIAQLGFFPFEAGFDAVELSRFAPPGSPAAAACAEYHLPIVRSSDSHYLEDVGCVATELTLEGPSFAELVLAVKSRQGRAVAMHDLSLYLLEMIENSLRAGAGRVTVHVWLEAPRDELTIAVEDDGPGFAVNPEQAADPFFTTKAGKKTGLGLSLFREAAEAAGGHLTMHRSGELGGAAIEAVMSLSHVDRPPLGDVVETVAVMAATNPEATITLEVGGGAESCTRERRRARPRRPRGRALRGRAGRRRRRGRTDAHPRPHRSGRRPHRPPAARDDRGR